MQLFNVELSEWKKHHKNWYRECQIKGHTFKNWHTENYTLYFGLVYLPQLDADGNDHSFWRINCMASEDIGKIFYYFSNMLFPDRKYFSYELEQGKEDVDKVIKSANSFKLFI